jgi:glycosyltransferase involved in cell wall biosynthesis
MGRQPLGKQPLDRQPRLAVVTDAWVPQINGVVTTLTKVVDLLRESGLDVSVVEPSQFRTVRLPKYSELRVVVSPLKAYRTLSGIDPEYVHIATEGPLGSVARFWCWRRGLPFSSSYHTRFPQYVKQVYGLPSGPVTKYMRWFHGGALQTLVPTVGMVRDLQADGFKNLVVWSRGVDSELFNPSARLADWYGSVPADQKVLVYVGRVSKEKSVEDFLQLASRPGYRCWVVGDGPQRKELERRYGDRVTFVGYKLGQELANFYASADVMVFSSRTDTFGNVMTESMACGTPVAAYPVTGPIDVVADGLSGALDENLADAVERALLCDRSKVRDYALEFSWDSCIATFRESLDPVSRRNGQTD